MGLAVVLMTAWAAAVWFGRGVGLLSGLVLATMYEFYAYSVLAEDDIFLAAAVAVAFTLFHLDGVRLRQGARSEGRILGQSTLAGVGVFLPAGGDEHRQVAAARAGGGRRAGRAYLLLSGDLLRIRRYIWLWGWLMFGMLLASWTLAAMASISRRYGELAFDYKDTTQYDQPFWYYVAVVLPAFLEPWILASITGFIVTGRAAIHRPTSAERFLWCWAILPVILLSVPHRKHHHYFVPSIAPWAILSAVGISIIWRDLTAPLASGRSNVGAARAVAAQSRRDCCGELSTDRPPALPYPVAVPETDVMLLAAVAWSSRRCCSGRSPGGEHSSRPRLVSSGWALPIAGAKAFFPIS